MGTPHIRPEVGPAIEDEVGITCFVDISARVNIMDGRAVFHGHMILYRDYVMTASQVLIEDPYPVGFPEMLTRAQMKLPKELPDIRDFEPLGS